MIVFLYRLMLRAYPKEFRARFGDEMLDTFASVYQDKGGSYAGCALLDLVGSVCREWASAISWQAAMVLLGACGVGLVIGYLDFHASEVQGTVLVILVVSAAFAALQPLHAWRWALCIAGGVPVWSLANLALHHNPTFPIQPDPYASFVALIPGFIGAYSGATVRLAINSPS